jgi:hypothetical protein
MHRWLHRSRPLPRPWQFDAPCDQRLRSGASTHSNDIIVLGAWSFAAITGVTSANYGALTQRGTTFTDGNGDHFSEWFIKAASPGSDTITITVSGGAPAFIVIPISCADFASPFDPNASNPASSVNPTATITATNANDILIGFQTAISSSSNVDTGFTSFVVNVNSANQAAGIEYKTGNFTGGITIGGTGTPARIYGADLITAN